jgi:glycosyltransferase involved in cell wall biosynthesis
MAGTLARAAVVVLLSDYEAHPLSVMEALALGRPVVGTDATGLHELVAQGLIAPASPTAGPAEIASAIQRQLDAPPRPPVHLPGWDDRVAALMALYRAVREEAACKS